jgi:uncharacterized membrane protein/mono/diheme cytochrome c family protein
MITEFIGHFHPLVVHLPIGILIFTFILELIQLKSKTKFNQAILLGTFIGTAFAIVSAIMGWLLSLDGGYDEKLLNNHQYAGWILCFFCILLVIVKMFFSANVYFDKLNKSLWSIIIIVLFLVGHFGGSITHGADYLSLDLSAGNKEVKKALSIDSISALPPEKQAQVNTYEGLIYPLLDAKCIQCHNSEKKKGNLQLTSIDLILKGGKKGPALTAYNANQSLMIQRMLLDPANDKHMPPKGKPQLNNKEINLIYWWVQHGASINDKLGVALLNDTVKNLIASKIVPAFPALSLPQTFLVDSNKINSLKQLGLIVHPIAKGVGYVDLSAMNTPLLNDLQLQKITILDSHLVWLNLANTKITNKSIATLSSCKNILKLNVAYTSLNDDAIGLLNQFTKLSYLNIVGTSITDNGLAKLNLSNNFKSLYCWNTKITQGGVDQFRKRYPNIQINFENESTFKK